VKAPGDGCEHSRDTAEAPFFPHCRSSLSTRSRERTVNGSVLLCLVPFVRYLLNAPLFTSFWPGGAISLLLFLVFKERAQVSGGGNPGPAVASRRCEQLP